VVLIFAEIDIVINTVIHEAEGLCQYIRAVHKYWVRYLRTIFALPPAKTLYSNYTYTSIAADCIRDHREMTDNAICPCPLWVKTVTHTTRYIYMYIYIYICAI